MTTFQWLTRPACRLPALPGRLLALAACVVLAACDTMVQVDATSVVPARYESVLITVKEIWFNESAAAVPTDETWQKFELDKTITIDLVDLTGGAITRIATDLKVPLGTYRQIRVFLASRDQALHNSADDVDAKYNNEVTWFNEDGDEKRAPLEVLNVEQGIGISIEVELEVKETVEGTPVQLLFDAARDLTEFRYGGRTGFLLNPTLKAFNPNDAGTIRGTLNLSRLSIDTGTGRPEIEVTAQKLDKVLNRRVIVGSASVSRAGTFVLYPLPLDQDKNTTEYDLVIHGPEIQTIVIRDVPVTEGAPDSAALLVPGILTLEPADSFEANVRDDDLVVPRGARIGFYQTLPGDDEPYLIEVATVDPISGRFAQPVALSRASRISYATLGVDVALRSGTPEEGAARYAVAALSPHYGSGALADTLLRPETQAADTAMFSVPAVGVPATAVSGTISATITIENPGRYDRGMLMVTQEGAVVTAASLDEQLRLSPASTIVDVAQVPAGTASASLERGMYYIEAWTWRSDDPEDTFTRHPGTAADLRATAVVAGSVAIH
jgi:hypothetical protein